MNFQATYDKLLNALKAHFQQMLSAKGSPRIGVVESYDPKAHAVRVLFQPENVASGWLPVGVMAAGGGTFRAAPSNGSQVLIIPQEDDIENGIVVCALHSVEDPVPQLSDQDPTTGAPVTLLQPGEGEWIGNSGTVALRMSTSGLVVIGDLGVSGNLICKGQVSDMTGTLDGLRQHYNQHTHLDPQGGNTETTSQPDPGATPPAPDPFLA